MIKKIIILLFLLHPYFLFSQLKHRVSFDDVRIVESVENKDYVEIKVNGLPGVAEKEGLPLLPFSTIQLTIPAEAEIESVKITDPVIETISLPKKILPFQGQVPTRQTPVRAFVPPLDAVYHTKSSYPEELVRIENIGYFDYIHPVASVSVCPFQYIPGKDQLLFYKSFTVELKFKTGKNNKTVPAGLKIKRSEAVKNMRHKVLRSYVDNPEGIQKESGEVFQTTAMVQAQQQNPNLGYEYVVITNQALSPAFERFVAWKKRKGIHIGVVTMEYIRSNYSGDLISGIYDDAGKLRQYLFDAYRSGLVYALLGGDNNTVPIRFGSEWDPYDNINSSLIVIPTDSYYADFNGDWNVDGDGFYGGPNDRPDHVSEIYVGRLLCSNAAEVENWTDKLIIYETNPGKGDFSYLKKAFYTQSDQMQEWNWAGDLIPVFNMFTTNTVFEEMYNGVKDYNSAELPQFPTGNDVVNEFNKNYGLVSFMGHGAACNVTLASQKINQFNADNTKQYLYTEYNPIHTGHRPGLSIMDMTNFDYPNINYSISCVTMPIDDGDRWHIGHENMGKYFTVKHKAGSVAYLGNTRDGWINSSRDLFALFGQEIKKGNYNIGIAEANSLANTYYRYLKYSHNLLGCPEMEMWTGIPSYYRNVSITENGSSVTVNTGGVTGSKICVMSSGDNGASYFQVQESVSTCTFSNVVKPYCVTITKHNYIPYQYTSPLDTYIQNQVYTSGVHTVTGRSIYAGRNVTNSKPAGEVIIRGSADVTFEAEDKIVIESGFEVMEGAKLTGKTK